MTKPIAYVPSAAEFSAARDRLQLDRYVTGQVGVPKPCPKRSPQARALERKELMSIYEGACEGVKPIPPKHANSFRIASFNVHSGKDYLQAPYRPSDSEFKAQLDQIRAVEPDVIGFQEFLYSDQAVLDQVSQAMGIAGDQRDQHVAFVKGCIGVHGCENPANGIDPNLETGNAIFSKYPLREVESLELTEGENDDRRPEGSRGERREQRSMVSAVAKSPIGDIKLAATHLVVSDPTSMICRRQVRQVCEHMEASNLPWVVMADTNGDHGKGLTKVQRIALAQADGARGASTDYGTLDRFFEKAADSFTAAGESLPASTVWAGRVPDFIFVSSELRDDTVSLKARVVQSFCVPSLASDHFMIVADIDATDATTLSRLPEDGVKTIGGCC